MPPPLTAKRIGLQRPRPHELIIAAEGIIAASAQEAIDQTEELVTTARASFDSGAPFYCVASCTSTSEGVYTVTLTLTSLTNKPPVSQDVAVKMDSALVSAVSKRKLPIARLGPDHKNQTAPKRPDKVPRPKPPKA